MVSLLIPVVLILSALVAGLVWASINDRFVKLEKQIEDLRTEIMFLRGELDLVKREGRSGAEDT